MRVGKRIRKALVFGALIIGMVNAALPVRMHVHAADYDKVQNLNQLGDANRDLTVVYIDSVADYKNFAREVNTGNSYAGMTVKLTKDLEFEKTYNNVDTIIDFRGTFDGCGHTISGVWIEQKDWYAGLFTLPVEAKIKNLTLKDCHFSAGDNGDAGAFIVGTGTNNTVDNCHIVNCDIAGRYAAGIAYNEANEFKVLNCTTLASEIMGNSKAAGIGIGANGKIYNCANQSRVACSYKHADNPYLGQAVGIGLGVICVENCYNTGEISSLQPYEIAYFGPNSAYADDCYYLMDDSIDQIAIGGERTNYKKQNVKGICVEDMASVSFLDDLNGNRSSHKGWRKWEYRKDICNYPLLEKVKMAVVQFNTSGADQKFRDDILEVDSAYGVLPQLVRRKYKFLGWYTAPVGGTKITASSLVKNKNKYAIYAHWLKISVPKAGKPKLVNKRNRTVTVQVKTVKGAEGYQIRYTTKSSMSNAKIISDAQKSTKIHPLRRGKKYYVQVRAYMKDSTNQNVYGAWSSKAKIKIKR